MAYLDVYNLVLLLSNNQADVTLVQGFYDAVVDSLGPSLWHTNAVPITFTEKTSTVNLPANLLQIIQIIYDDTVLTPLDLRELESIKWGWRNAAGSPVAFTAEAENVKTIEVFPIPVLTSPAIVPVHGLPTGEDYKPGNGISIHSETRADVLDYLTLPVALKVLTREYLRESIHKDFAFGMLCDALGGMLLKMLM